MEFKAQGVVVLEISGKPIVTNISDIGTDWLSFFLENAIDLAEEKITLDILIFESLTNFEYLIDQVKGRLTSSALLFPYEQNVLGRECRIDLIDLCSNHRHLLNLVSCKK